MSSLKGVRVFVSGGAGVIGRSLVPKLVQAGAIVWVGDLQPRPDTWTPEIRYRQGDLNYLTIRDFIEFKPEVFIHLAATFERSVESSDFWDSNFEHNLKLSHHLMTLVKNSGFVRRVVFASSYLIYDPSLYLLEDPNFEPGALSEIDPIRPRNLVGMAKLEHEAELSFLNLVGKPDMSTVSVRIFRGYGFGSRCIISRWVRMLLNGEPITVFRPEGRFDFIFAEDSAQGLFLLAENSDIEGVLNMGTGIATSIQSIVDELKIIFPDMKVNFEDSDLLFEASRADTTKLQEVLGWIPPSRITETLESIVDFERKSIGHISDKPLKVLLSSSSAKYPLLKSIEGAITKIGCKGSVVVGDANPDALLMKINEESWIMPPTSDEYLEEMILGMCNLGVNVVIPTRDAELSFYARNLKKFNDNGINIMISPPEGIIRCLDKLEFFKHCLLHDIPAIPTYSNLTDIESTTGFFVIKEQFGAGSKSIGIKLDREQTLLHTKFLNTAIYQPYISGIEYSIDAYSTMQGQFKGAIVRSRDEIINGESRITTTIEDDEAVALAKRVMEVFNLRGHIVIQFIRNREGINLIECNPRVGGASTLSFSAGLDSLWWFLLEALGVDVVDYPFNKSTKPIKLFRVPSDLLL